jgi:hypothetical protein
MISERQEWTFGETLEYAAARRAARCFISLRHSAAMAMARGQHHRPVLHCKCLDDPREDHSPRETGIGESVSGDGAGGFQVNVMSPRTGFCSSRCTGSSFG